MQWYALAVDWSLQSSSYRVTGDGVQPWIFFFVWGCRALSKQSWTQSRNRNVHRTSEKLIVFFLDSLALIIPDPAWQSQDFDGYVFCSEISHWFMTPASTEKSWFWKDTIQQQKTQSNTEWPKQWHWLVSSFFRMIRDWLITTGCNSNVVQYCGELRVASGFQWATIAGYWVYWILKGSDSAIMYISIPDLDFAGNQASESPIVFPGIRRQTKPGMGAGEAPIACRVAQQFCKNHGMKNLVPTMRIPQLIYSKCNHIW